MEVNSKVQRAKFRESESMVMSLLHVYKCVGVCVWVISTAPGQHSGMGCMDLSGGRSDIRNGSGRGGDSILREHSGRLTPCRYNSRALESATVVRATVCALVDIIAAGQYDKEGAE